MTTAPATATARDYQTTAVDQLRAAIRAHGSAVYVLATGAGKTVVAALIAQSTTGRGGQIMLVVHRRELVRQARDTLHEAVPGLDIGVEAPGWPSMPWAPLQVCMIQSMVCRAYVARMRPAVVFWDEAHHVRASSWETALAWWPEAAHIGLTATPERLDGKGLGAHFGAMVQGPTIQQLVADGWLAPCRTLAVPVGIDLAGLRANRRGEYSTEIAERITDRVVADAADAYTRYAAGRRAIFFGEDRSHSRRVAEKLMAQGVRAAHVDGEDPPARRDRIMAEFRAGALDVVCNCDIISEGFDAPSCDTVILGKHTASVTRYLQWCGRAARPGPEKIALILDLVQVSYELGLPDETREWTLADGEVKTRPGGKRELKACPECRTMYYGPRCPECAYQPPMPAPPAETPVDLEEAPGRADTRPRGGRRAELYAEMAVAGRAPNVRAALEELGRRRGYKPGWARYILEAWGLG